MLETNQTGVDDAAINVCMRENNAEFLWCIPGFWVWPSRSWTVTRINNSTSTLSVLWLCLIKVILCLSPLPLLVDAGADTNGAQLPARRAVLPWFGHKTKGACIGVVFCKRVEILPLGPPLKSIRFSWKRDIFHHLILFMTPSYGGISWNTERTMDGS